MMLVDIKIQESHTNNLIDNQKNGSSVWQRFSLLGILGKIKV
jgi:hypothetical protein